MAAEPGTVRGPLAQIRVIRCVTPASRISADSRGGPGRVHQGLNTASAATIRAEVRPGSGPVQHLRAFVAAQGAPDQLTPTAVSSMTNDVWSLDPSVPVNFTVTVCPAYPPRLKLRRAYPEAAFRFE